jgi:protein STE50
MSTPFLSVVFISVLTYQHSGDTFVILSRARGWWVVQRDPSGFGIVDTDMSEQRWVPAGCFLETNVPVASAVEIASSSNSASPKGKTSVLPLNIITSSYRAGIALLDYEKRGEGELELVKDELLRVFMRYNHWSYVSHIGITYVLV